MPEFHNFDDTFLRVQAVVDKVRVAAKTPDVPTFSIRGAKFREIGEQFRAIDEGPIKGATVVQIFCCNGHYWRILWSDPPTKMSYTLELSLDTADAFSQDRGPQIVAIAHRLAALAGKLVQRP